MKLNLPTKLSLKQALALAKSDGRVNILDGSVRSGKTYIFILRWATIMADPPKGGNFVIFGKSTDTIYRNIFAPIENEDTFAFIAPFVTYRQGAPTATILGRKVDIIGANDNRAESRIRGMTIAAAMGDELTVLPENFIKQMFARMSPPGAILLGTTNPDSPSHWLKTEYLDRLDQHPNWRYYHFTLDDNPSLSDEYKDSIKREYTGLWYRRFILGEWAAAEGAIYDMWDPAKHVIPWDDLPRITNMICLGIDYGTQNPTSAILLGLGEDHRLYAVDEWRLDDTNRGQTAWTDAEQSRAILNWLHNTEHTPNQEDLQPAYTIIDPAAASLKVQMRQDGAPPILDAYNPVTDGIRLVANGLKSGWLKISDRCQGVIKEITGYTWDPKAQAAGEDRPLKKDDHSLDALRYAIATTERTWRRHVTTHHREK
ncbi:PBSX family phage terminase large subunit [Actinobaculum sp. 352]|uniref:PBSX family phage terminase large subunit n=1 Tax=Actinobaculum sp. 352 TaxID=2490946 RepID=UPI000F7F3811|nr:PBSX family phage terminase large subunit [Actinobaculum sp. 352]RTE47901.1 PBSX family phage terminase large subunit [Actinobaculum sp. 352]